jgi:polysaccharide deacetylase 2 family uncharacterized protein YibQ
MASRRRSRRRRTSWIKRLRRYLIEHRFNAAEGVIGAVALGVGLWLLWPASDHGTGDHRRLWQESLAAVRATGEADEDSAAGRLGVAAPSTASGSVSAMGEVVGHKELPRRQIEARRLARVGETMPAIGPLEEYPDPATDELMVFLPDAWAPGTVEDPPTALAGLVVPRRFEDPAAPTWLRNAVPAVWPQGRPGIAVVIDDLGLNRKGTAALNQLPGPLTLSFLPYAGDLDRQARAGRAAGHELMLHVPMEPTTEDFPGPNALLSSLTPDETLTRFRGHLRSFRGFAGVNNHMGSLLTTDRARMAVLMGELRQRGLAFLDSRTTSQSIAADEARRHGVPHTVRDVFLDNELGLSYVLRQLREVEQVARRNGTAVAIGHPHDATIEALRRWLPTLERKGFALVPVSAIIARKACQTGLIAISTACGLYVAAAHQPTTQ